MNDSESDNVLYEAEIAKTMTYREITDDDSKVTDCEEVKFSAFFTKDVNNDGYVEKYAGTCNPLENNVLLYFDINVSGGGKLENGKIAINGKNFKLSASLVSDVVLKKNYIGSDIRTIEFNTIQNGTQKLFEGTISAYIGNNINNYSVKDNTVTLTGTWVSDDGQISKEITKVVTLETDWYGRTLTKAYPVTTTHSISSIVDGDSVVLKFDVGYKENIGYSNSRKGLLIKKQRTEVIIPDFNGYSPLAVSVSSKNCTFNYNDKTRLLAIERNATVSDSGVVTQSVSYANIYSIEVRYDLEAYNSITGNTISISVPSVGYYYGFNNTSPEFASQNPYISSARSSITHTWSRPSGSAALFEVRVLSRNSGGLYISKKLPLQIYNGSEIDDGASDEYLVSWECFTGNTVEDQNGIYMEEYQPDCFETSIDMSKYVRVKGIYFSNLDRNLEDNGWVKVYNGVTGELIITFTKENLQNISSSTPYYFDEEIKSIKIETSKINNSSRIYVYQIKEIDDDKLTMDFTYEEFSGLKHIWSHLTGGLFRGSQKYRINTDKDDNRYEEPYSKASFKYSPYSMANNETRAISISIQTKSGFDVKGWKNGEFLVELPDEFLDIEITGISCSSSKVDIVASEVYEMNGNKYIKIFTSNDEACTYILTINAKATPDPRKPTITKKVKLYASNEECSNYLSTERTSDVFDINENGNTSEYVFYEEDNFNIIAPSSILTHQTISDFDDSGEIVISPQVAMVDRSKEDKDARISFTIANNYSGTISEPIIVGKIPFAGNTYQLSGSDLGSTFSTMMKSTGIILPDAVKDKAKVYYSTKEIVNQNISDSANSWKTASQLSEEDWKNVKCYAVDLSDYVLSKGEILTFSYDIVVPKNLAYNAISYSTHGIYFCLDTQNGKLRTQTEVSRLGMMIVKKYKVEVTKYQKGANNVAEGVMYSLTEEGQSSGKTGKTDEFGQIMLSDVYAERTYILKEIKVPSQYELNNEEVRFTTKIDDDGNLVPILLSGTLRQGTELKVRNTDSGFVLEIQMENELRPTVILKKVKQGTDEGISYVKYKLTGKGHLLGSTYRTDINGNLNLGSLYVNEEYILEELSAEGYYLNEPIRFRIINNNGEYSVETLSGVIFKSEYSIVNNILSINLKIEDEKIPTFDLELTKIKKVIDGDETTEETTYLPGAKFMLTKNGKQLGIYETGDDGKVVIHDLYQYVSDKEVDQTYKLREIIIPDGYTKVKDITFKVEEIDGNLQFIEELSDGQSEKKYTVDGNTIKLIIEDSPVFRLIKQDAETKEKLAGVKFVIYNIDSGEETPAVNGKGEFIGTKEIINGKEYYTMTTNENGEFTADLVEGLYKAVEVEAPDMYDLSKAVYYFGIGTSTKGRKDATVEWGEILVGRAYNQSLDISAEITAVAATPDGGYLVGGYSWDGAILGENTVLPAFIAKYSKDGIMEKVIDVGACGKVTAIESTTDGEFVIGIDNYFTYGDTEIFDFGNGVTLSYFTAAIIKYDKDGVAQWAKGDNSGRAAKSIIAIPGGGCVVASSAPLELYDEEGNLVSASISEYDVNGNIIWSKEIDVDGYSTSITSFDKTISGEYIVGIMPIPASEYGYIGKMGVIKYDRSGNVIWSKLEDIDINCDNQSSGTGSGYPVVSLGYFGGGIDIQVCATLDGGYVVAQGSIIINDEGSSNTVISNKITKYDSQDNIEWENLIYGAYGVEIKSIIQTSDGGYLIGGRYAEKCSLENYNGILLIKYNAKGKEEWAKKLNETVADSAYGIGSGYISSIAEIAEGEYVVGGRFNGDADLGNGIMLTSNVKYPNGMVFRIKETEMASLSVKEIDNTLPDSGIGINSIRKTNDGGYIVAGNLENNIITGDDLIDYKGIIIKYTSDGNVEWKRETERNPITSMEPAIDGGCIIVGLSSIVKYDKDGKICWTKNAEDGVGSVLETSDGGYIVTGNSKITKYDSNGVSKWTKDVANLSGYNYVPVTETSDSDYIVCYRDGFNFDNSVLIKYDKDGNEKWSQMIHGVGDDNNVNINSMSATSDGGWIVHGEFDSIIVSLGSDVHLPLIAENVDEDEEYNPWGTMIIKYDRDGVIEYAQVFGDPEGVFDATAGIVELSNGKYIFGEFGGALLKVDAQIGASEVSELVVENVKKQFNITTDIEEIDGEKGGEISGEDQMPYEKVIYDGTSNNEIRMTPKTNYEIIKVTINGEEVPFSVDENGSCLLDQFTNMKEDKHVVVTFGFSQNKIAIKKIDSKTKNVVPGAKFKLEQIEVDEPYSVEVETNFAGEAITQVPFGKYKLTEIVAPDGYEKLENPIVIDFNSNEAERKIVENKNTVGASVNAVNKYEFEIENRKLGEVIVHHYIKDKFDESGNPVKLPVLDEESGEIKEAQDEYYTGKIDTNYATSPRIDGFGYELEYTLQSDNLTKEYIVPSTAAGKYTDEPIEVIYYYVEVPFKLTVHHYLEGTTNMLVDDVITDVYKNPGDYEAQPSTTLLEDYYLIPEATVVNLDEEEYEKDPETNYVTGKIKQDTEVTYYYRLKEHAITTRVNPITITRYSEISNEYEEMIVKGGSISGEDETPYETVLRKENSINEIKATPLEGYRVKRITINDVDINDTDIGFTTEADGSVILSKFIEMIEDKEVVVEFEPIVGNVVIYHYIEGTTDPVPLDDGMLAGSENRSGYVGDPYATKPLENIAENYEYISSKGETSGKFKNGTEDEPEVVIYYYTEIKISGTKNWTANVDRTMLNADGEEAKYVLEKDIITYIITAKNDGKYDKEVIVKDEAPVGTTFVGNIKINEVVDNTKTEDDLREGITVNVPAGEEVTVSFDVSVNSLDEGIYEREIRNTAVVNGKNTEPEVVVPVKKPNVIATKLANPVSESKVADGNDITYKIELNNSTGTAPTKVKVKDSAPKGTLFKDGSIRVDSVDVDGTVIEGTSIDLSGKTETDLRDTGIEVELNAKEVKVLSFVVTVVDTDDGKATDLSNNTTITNIAQVSKNPEDANPTYEDTNEVTHTYVEPIITAVKDWNSENKKKGNMYVEEGETVTFTIAVKNEGRLGKDVNIKDTIQSGMTFVAGSIKVNGKDTSYVLDDLQTTGIIVNVPAKVGDVNGTAIVSFDITVDKLPEGMTSRVLRNQAVVDDVSGNEVEINVLKLDIKSTKIVERGNTTGNIDKESVQIGEELTYKIKVWNDGTLDGTATIYDSVPVNTEFVAGSIQVDGKSVYTANGEEVDLSTKDASYLTNGISLELPTKEEGNDIVERVVSFKVKVLRTAEDADVIENTARINNTDTNKTENPVVRPIIDVQKEIAEVTHMNEGKEIEGLKDRKDYVFRGDKITYNIRVTNAGGLEGKVIIKDVISDKVNLDIDSIKVDSTVISGMTADKFASDGIEVTVPAKTADGAGEVMLSFTVIVKGDASVVDEYGVTGDVENQARWSYKISIEDPDFDPENPDIPIEHNTKKVKVPVVVIEKKAEIVEKTKESVTAKDEIKYTIVVTNTGTSATGKFVVTDDIPEGTTILNSNGGTISDRTISWTIGSLLAKQEDGTDNIVEISFTVTVDYDAVASKNIVNVAYVNDKPTNETETPYVKPTPKIISKVEKTGDNIVIGDKIYYKITYTATIENFVGKANIVIEDQLPYEIDESNSNLEYVSTDGTVSDEVIHASKNLKLVEVNGKTIEWEMTEDIDTYKEGKPHEIRLVKEMLLYYDVVTLPESITNKAVGTIQLKELNPENQEEYIDVGKPISVDDTHTVRVKTMFKLPETGRNGTMIFAIIGLMIVGMAVVIGYKTKFKKD